MIKQLIDIDGYWEVIVYYNVDYNFFSDIAFELKAIGSPVERIDDADATEGYIFNRFYADTVYMNNPIEWDDMV